jgi:probable F420-dependent oxidoreductase
MTSPKIGLNVMTCPGQQNPIETAVWAEREGYESVWMTDGGGRMDAFTAAAAVGALTERVRIGLSIVPVFTRPAAVLATSAATLSHVARDRMVLGLGSSSETMIAKWYGVPFEKPLTRVRETLTVLRQMLAGEKTNFQGETISSTNFRLGVPVCGQVPIYVAGLRSKMLELAGEMADGVVLNLCPVEVLPRILEHIDTGAKRVGRRVDDLEITSLLNVFVTDDEDSAVQTMNRVALGYYSAGVYNKFLTWMGYEAQAVQIREGFTQRNRAQTESALDEEVVRKLGIIGDAASCKRQLEAYGAAGLDTAIIGAASQDEAVYRSTLEAFTHTA